MVFHVNARIIEKISFLGKDKDGDALVIYIRGDFTPNDDIHARALNFSANDSENYDLVKKKLNELIAESPFNLSGREVSVSSSIGLAMYPEDGTNAFALQHCADLDMYRVKEQSNPQTPPSQAA